MYEQLLKRKSPSESEKARNRKILEKLFKIVYFISQKRWGLVNYEDFARFVAFQLEEEDLNYHLLSAPSNATYLSSTICTELVTILGNDIERKNLQSLRNARAFSLLADESKDEQNREQLSIFCKWIPPKNIPCFNKNSDHFMGIINVQRTDSATLCEAIVNFFKSPKTLTSRNADLLGLMVPIA